MDYSSEEDSRPHFKKDKNFDLYGVFASDMKSDSEEEQKAPRQLSKKNFLNFQRQGTILHDANKKVQVKMSVNALKRKQEQEYSDNSQNDSDSEISQQIEEDIDSRVRGFHNLNQEKPIEKKVKAQSILSSQTVKEQEMEKGYGNALKMMKNMGYDVNKGLGKNKQGRVDPVQAIEKKAMSSNYENQVKNIGKQVTFKEDIKEEIQEEQETCEVVRRWEKPQYQRKSGGPKQKEEYIKEEKIVDMRGESFTDKKILAVFLEGQKQEWQKVKNKQLKLIQRKKQIEASQQSLNQEKEGNQSKITVLTQEKNVLQSYQTMILQMKNKQLEAILKIGKDVYKLHRKMFERYKVADLCVSYITKCLKDQNIDMVTQNTISEIKSFLDIIYPDELACEDHLAHDHQKTKADLYLALIVEKALLQKLIFLAENDLDRLLELLENIQVLPCMQKLCEVALQAALQNKIQTHDWSLPLHCKILPFFPYLPDFTRNALLDDIFQSLKNVIMTKQVLNLADSVLPFKELLEEKNWKVLVLRSIIPKLLFILNKIEIDPSNQQVDELEQIFSWVPALEQKELSLLFKMFLMKIQKIGNQWKSQGGNKEEMGLWLDGWKCFLPEKVVQMNVQFFEQLEKQILQ